MPRNQSQKMSKKRFTFNDEKIKNSYGFYILTAGIDTTRFNRNPICLNDHSNWTGAVLGTWADLSAENGALSGTPNFDTKDKYHKEVIRQVESGTIKGCSMGVLFDEADFTKNEKGELVLTKCELMEVSIVAIPSNANSVALYHKNGVMMKENEVKTLCLSFGENTEQNHNQNNNFNMKKIHLSVLAFVALGFAKTTKEVDEAELDEAILGLKAKIDEQGIELQRAKADLSAYQNAEKLAQEGKITTMVELAVKEGRITAEHAQTYKDLAAQNFELAQKTLESFPKKVDLSTGIITPAGNDAGVKTMEDFQKLSHEKQLSFKNENPDLYKAIVEAAE